MAIVYTAHAAGNAAIGDSFVVFANTSPLIAGTFYFFGAHVYRVTTVATIVSGAPTAWQENARWAGDNTGFGALTRNESTYGGDFTHPDVRYFSFGSRDDVFDLTWGPSFGTGVIHYDITVDVLDTVGSGGLTPEEHDALLAILASVRKVY